MQMQDIKQGWPLSSIISIERFNDGVINDSYHVKTVEGEYVLRLYTHASTEDILFEHALLTHIASLPVPHFQEFSNSPIVTIGERHGVIYPYIEGKTILDPAKKHRESIGEFLAQLHTIGQSFNSSLYKKKRIYDFSTDKVRQYTEDIAGAGAISEAIVDDLASCVISSIDVIQSLSSGPIHVDVKAGNVLFLDDTLSGVIDFDNAYIGPYILDLSKSMMWYGSDRGKFNMTSAMDILGAYTKHRALSEDAKMSLFQTMLFSFVSHILVDAFYSVHKVVPVAHLRYVVDSLYEPYLDFKSREDEFNRLIESYI